MYATDPTQLLRNISAGDARAADELLKLVYPVLLSWRSERFVVNGPTTRSRPQRWFTRPISS